MFDLIVEIFRDLDIFFSRNQLLDFKSSKHCATIQTSIALVQQAQNPNQMVFALLQLQEFLLPEGGKNGINFSNGLELIQLGGISLILGVIQKTIDKRDLDSSWSNISLAQQMIVKLCFNLLRLALPVFKPSLFQQASIDKLCIRLIQLSLDVIFIPIRKVCIVFGLYLLGLFSKECPSNEHFQQLKHLRITQLLVKKCKIKRKANSVQNFYKENIQGFSQSKLAQIIVVGLLRALLSTCPQHKAQQSGVDISKQWKLSLDLWAGSPAAEQFSDEGSQRSEAETHGLKASISILALLVLIMGSFYKNCPLQATYFIELLSDANGVLVLLKFISLQKFIEPKKDRGLTLPIQNPTRTCFQRSQAQSLQVVLRMFIISLTN